MNPSEPGFDELVRQVALGQGFQLLVVIAPPDTNPYWLAERVSLEVEALRGQAQDTLVLDPQLTTRLGRSLTAESLIAQVLAPLFDHTGLQQATDPLVVVDATGGQMTELSMSERRAWEQFLGVVNLRRNWLIQAFSGTLLWQMDHAFMAMFSEAAPDLWSVRSGVISLTERGGSPSGARGSLAAESEIRRRLVSSQEDPAALREAARELVACLRDAGVEQAALDLETAIEPPDVRSDREALRDLLVNLPWSRLYGDTRRWLPELGESLPSHLSVYQSIDALTTEAMRQGMAAEIIEMIRRWYPGLRERAEATAAELGIDLATTRLRRQWG